MNGQPAIYADQQVPENKPYLNDIKRNCRHHGSFFFWEKILSCCLPVLFPLFLEKSLAKTLKNM